jgi:malate dehydrogenase (oxaloacetate-decarboxylating)(NADP+)
MSGERILRLGDLSGSPFAPVTFEGRRLVPGQSNNLYRFLAIYSTRAKRVTDEMFIEAARALAELVTPAELEMGLLHPSQSKIL